MIDADGFRANVGVIVANEANQVLWGKRLHQDAWQFPQGGVDAGEDPEQAMLRELHEEMGISADNVEFIASTSKWLRYYLPKPLIRDAIPRCIGQKQKWFLLRLLGSDSCINLDITAKPEFDAYSWVNYWYPIGAIVAFKRDVYRKALRELAPKLFPFTSSGRRTRPLNNILE